MANTTTGRAAWTQERDELPDGRSKQAFLRRREMELAGEDCQEARV